MKLTICKDFSSEEEDEETGTLIPVIFSKREEKVQNFFRLVFLKLYFSALNIKCDAIKQNM